MKILVACEFSGIVRNAFALLGHDAWSCDLLPSELPGNHIQDDVLKHLNEGWDMMIAHPPCKYLSFAANRVWNTPGRYIERIRAVNFALELMSAPIDKICIENPNGYLNQIIPHSQLIYSNWFNCKDKKRIMLWLKNLPPLISTAYYNALPSSRNAKGSTTYYVHKFNSGDKNRSKFFPGVAAAMANQWS